MNRPRLISSIAARLPNLTSGHLLLPAATILWMAGVVAGLVWLWSYESTPGQVANPPDHWPLDSAIPLDFHHPTLVVFAHPLCPCTRATIRELELIMARCPGLVTTHVRFFEPHEASAEWETSDIWTSAASIPGVQVAMDDEGAEARKFGAVTSGFVVLYDTDGHLIFHGGITGSRGHSGDNVGRTAIESLLSGEKSAVRQTYTFGCPLLGREREGSRP